MMRPRMETLGVKAGRSSAPGASLNAPLVPSSNFVLGGDRAYSRNDGTPTWEAFEEAVGALEGADAIAFSSGMAAIAAVFDQLRAGARIVWPEDCYQGVAGLIADGEQLGRWTATRLPASDTAAWCAAATAADLIWLESPSNPLLEVCDLQSIVSATRPDGPLVAIDNTLAGPLAQQPLEVGADLVVQSATKHLGGHSDLLCGVVTTCRPDLVAKLRKHRELRGATPGVFESFLATRGIRTYALRAAAAAASAGELARRLELHERVEVVRYPGLASHPTHAVAADQLRSFGSVISFDVVGGADSADEVCHLVRVIEHATSFGAVESTIERRAAIPGQEHIPPGLLRLSVGIEHVDDLWDDLTQALR